MGSQDKDRPQSEHASILLGRQTKDAVTTPGGTIDTRVLALATAYDTGGRPYLFTSYNSATGTDPVANQVNQVQRTFNGLYQLTGETQTHGNSQVQGLTVSYAYSFVGTSGGPNHSRLTQIVYPNGHIVRDEYNSRLDASISRLSFLADDNMGQVGTRLEEYSYLGLNTVVKRAHPEPAVDLTYIKQSGEPNGDAGDQYAGLDRFGRVGDQRWIPTATPLQPTDRFQYGYDRDSNRQYRNNLVNALFGELYHASGQGQGYDIFNQITAFERGTLFPSRPPNGPLDSITADRSWRAGPERPHKPGSLCQPHPGLRKHHRPRPGRRPPPEPGVQPRRLHADCVSDR